MTTAQSWLDQTDEQVFSEPILAKKDCQLRIDFAEPATWKVKDSVPTHAGQEFKAAKLTLTITDPNVQTEHQGWNPRRVIEHQFNVEKYPFMDKKTGTLRWLNRANLFELEEAFGFEPVFVDPNGVTLPPFITKAGRKVAPKVEGVQRKLNPDFARAYFHEDGTVNPDNWTGKTVYADVDVEKSDQFGDRNRIVRFKVAPAQI